MPEEQAFSVLVKIMFDYGLRDLFKQNFEDLHCKFFQLERLMQVCVISGSFTVRRHTSGQIHAVKIFSIIRLVVVSVFELMYRCSGCLSLISFSTSFLRLLYFLL